MQILTTFWRDWRGFLKNMIKKIAQTWGMVIRQFIATKDLYYQKWPSKKL